MRSRWLLMGVGGVLLAGAALGFWSLGSVKNVVARDLKIFAYEDSLPSLRRSSERFHLIFAGAQAPELKAQYLVRRLYAVIAQIQRGNSGIAYKSLTALEHDLQALVHNSVAADELKPLRAKMGEVQALLAEELPASPLYRLKQRLEDEAVLLAGTDKQAVILARLAALDTRLSEAESLLAKQALEEMGLSLEAVRQGGINIERDLQVADLTEEKLGFSARLRTIRVREKELEEKLSFQLAPAPQLELASATSTLTLAAATSSAQNSSLTGIEIIPVSYPVISPGASLKLTVKALRRDGSTTSVTSRVKWVVLDPKLGSVISGVFTAAPKALGPVIIKAEYGENEIVKNYQIVVTIR